MERLNLSYRLIFDGNESLTLTIVEDEPLNVQVNMILNQGTQHWDGDWGAVRAQESAEVWAPGSGD